MKKAKDPDDPNYEDDSNPDADDLEVKDNVKD